MSDAIDDEQQIDDEVAEPAAEAAAAEVAPDDTAVLNRPCDVRPAPPSNVAYRQLGDGRFEITCACGIADARDGHGPWFCPQCKARIVIP